MACKKFIPDDHGMIEYNGIHYRVIDFDFPNHNFKPDPEWTTTECAQRKMAEKLGQRGAFRLNKVKCRECLTQSSIIMTRLD